MIQDDGAFEGAVRRHFLARWVPGCEAADIEVALLPENSDESPVAGARAAEIHFIGTRDNIGGTASDPMERTLGRVQLTFWLPRGWAIEDRDKVQRIWRPMWTPAEVSSNPELEGIHFYSVQRLAERGKTETHVQYVSDVQFRWDE